MKGLIFCYLFLIGLLANAQEVLLDPKNDEIDASSRVGIVEDKLSSESFEQIQERVFIQNKSKHILIPFSNHAFWIKCKLKNATAEPQKWVVRWENPLTERIDFYVQETPNGRFARFEKGSFREKHHSYIFENTPSLTLSFAPHQTQTLYLKVVNKRGIFSRLVILPVNALERTKYSSIQRWSILDGSLLIRLIYTFILALFVIKDLSFKRYSAFIFIRTFSYWGMIGVFGGWLTTYPYWATIANNVAIFLSPIGYTFAIRSVVDIRLFSSYVVYLLRVVLGLTVLFALLILLDYQWYWLKGAVFLNLGSQYMLLGIIAVACYRRYRVNWSYGVPLLLGVASYSLVLTRLLGGLQWAGLFEVALLFFVLELLFFGLYLGRIIRTYEEEQLTIKKELYFKKIQTNQLQELDELKTNFFVNISHELRTPLTLIGGYMEDLRRQNPQNQVYEIVSRNAQRLLVLINQLLDLSKLEAGQLQVTLRPLRLDTYLKTLFSAYQSLAESKKIRFTFHQSQQEVVGEVDQDKLEKIVTNLLSNAFKFTDAGKKVEVGVDYAVLNNRLIIRVKDEGVGIPNDKLAQIFNRFYQVERPNHAKYEGTGVGLALVKELVNALNGTIQVQSKEGEGSTFRVELPVTYRDDVSIDAEHPQSPLEWSSVENKIEKTSSKHDVDLRLLVVDDNADIRQYIRSIFEKDYWVVEAENGKIGIEKAFEMTPDIIVSDLMMPEMDGFEFCKRLKSDDKTSHIPIIMLSAKANPESRIESWELGADDYLLKPFQSEEVRVRVQTLLEKQARLRTYFSAVVGVEKPTTETEEASKEQDFLLKLYSLVEQRMSDSEFTAELCAKEMGMSQSQLLRKLKALTNQTINEYIRDFRLQRAARLITQNEATVSEIVYEVGFTNLSYFTKMFKEKYGKLPSEFLTQEG